MILYNVTIGIDQDIEKEWLQWMKTKHIPDVMNTGFFANFRIFKVLNQDQEDTVSYSVQYFTDSINKVVQYLNEHAPRLSEEHRLRFNNRHVAFRTLLEEISPD